MLVFTVSLVTAWLVGSLVEYWGHRLMHGGWLLTRGHLEHHESNEAKGVWPEFLHYLKGTAVLMPWLFLHSVAAGSGWLAGGLLYGFFSAYGHQLQHDNPRACFWMPRMPVHWVHHRYGMDHANFGLALDWWDRAFGTYRRVRFDPAELRAKYGPGLFDVRWW